ncbi:MAG: YvcK family protein [Anaerosomatales bacterium]|nr:YvcK family protein [Anaerosomatales bacterium]
MTAGVCRAVAIGGGTGLPRVLRCLVSAGMEPTAIVTMADDGGSSGELRRTLGMLPPGDVRNCLAALAPEGSDLAAVFQYRFERGEGLAGHALGNLIIAALAEIEGGFAEAVDEAARLLGITGAVVPSTLADVRLEAVDAHGQRIEGQARAAVSEGPLARVELVPAAPEANPRALDAIASADFVVIGPGSLFTSVIPNLLVAGVRDALAVTTATVIYVCNVANQRGETAGMDAADHVQALVDHGMDGVIDVALVHEPGAGPGPSGEAEMAPGFSPVAFGAPQRERIAALGPRVVGAPMVDPADPLHHDPAALGRALQEVWGCPSPRR